MIRTVFRFTRNHQVNIENVINEIKMMSGNQMNIYHTILEAHNIAKYSSSEQIKIKWNSEFEKNYHLRSETKNYLKVPVKPFSKCTRFSYNAAKLYNMLPKSITETFKSSVFKAQIKDWIWKNIPSY